MDTLGDLSRYWTRPKWVPGKGPEDDYCLYRLHEIKTGEASYGKKRVYYTNIGVIQHFYGAQSFTPHRDPWLDNAPLEWFVAHYNRYGEHADEEEFIGLVELSLC